MATLATHLADGLDVRCEQRIRRLEALGHDHPPRWTLKRAADAGDPHSIEVTEGIFEAVVVATPPPLAMPLLEGCTQRFGELRAVSMEPCFALLLGFSAPLELDFDAAHVDGPRLAWIARDSAKPQRRPGEHWIAHATWAWSREHFDDDPEDVRAKLVKAFGEACGTPAQPIYSSVYRWTYSVAARPLPQPFLWESSERLGVCGDWCGGGRVESAWLSGRALGVAIIESLRLSR
jgi:predicted NAD/FAD-dependent oxidoreductase